MLSALWLPRTWRVLHSCPRRARSARVLGRCKAVARQILVRSLKKIRFVVALGLRKEATPISKVPGNQSPPKNSLCLFSAESHAQTQTIASPHPKSRSRRLHTKPTPAIVDG